MTNAPTITAAHARTLADTLLDRAYVQTVAPVIQLIEDSADQRLVQRRLTELQDEVTRLKASGKSIDRDNPILAAFIAALDAWLKRVGSTIDGLSPAIQRSGIEAAGPISTALALPGVSDPPQYGWQLPDPDVVEETVNYASKPSWRDKVDAYSAAIVAVAMGMIDHDVHNDPTALVGDLQGLVDSLPRSQADTLMRTLQMEATRGTQRMIAVANSDLVVVQIRVAQLDGSTCMACIAEHGTEIPLGDQVEDHPNGRCMGVLVVHGRDYNVETGEDYFNSLDEAQQADMMGPGAYSAYQAGAINLQDFVHRYTDDTFGPTLRQASLKGMLGDSAQQYYRQQGGQ